MDRGSMAHDEESAMIASLRRLSLMKPSYADALGSRRRAEVDSRATDVAFVPDLLFSVLLSHERCVEDLHRILRLDCVRQWNGWRESEQKLLQCTSDEETEFVAAEFVQRLWRIVRDNRPVQAQSDASRRQELRD
eukprot:10440040-Lingulodinium_polyedra.AAC.1